MCDSRLTPVSVLVCNVCVVLQEFSNLRLMMTRMSNRVSQKTGFDPSLGKDAVVRCSTLLTTHNNDYE